MGAWVVNGWAAYWVLDFPWHIVLCFASAGAAFEADVGVNVNGLSSRRSDLSVPTRRDSAPC